MLLALALLQIRREPCCPEGVVVAGAFRLLMPPPMVDPVKCCCSQTSPFPRTKARSPEGRMGYSISPEEVLAVAVAGKVPVAAEAEGIRLRLGSAEGTEVPMVVAAGAGAVEQPLEEMGGLEGMGML